VEWQFLTDITKQAIGPIFKDNKIQDFFDFLTIADEIDKLSQNFSKELSLYMM
jgi:hypothetical protein